METVHIKNDWSRFDGESFGHSENELGQFKKDIKKTHAIIAYKVRWE